MKTKTMIIIGLSVVVAGGLGFWLYKRNKNKKMIGSDTTNTGMSAVNPNVVPPKPKIDDRLSTSETKATPKNVTD